MHECLLCERDMKKSKDIFGSGCTNNIFKFLNIEKPTRCKNKEQLLYKNIMKITNVSKINNNQKIWLTDRYLTYQYLNQLHYGDFENLTKQLRQDIENIDKVEEFDKLITARKTGQEVALQALQKSGKNRKPDYYMLIASSEEEKEYAKGIRDIIGDVPCFGGGITGKNTFNMIYTEEAEFSEGAAVAFFYTSQRIENIINSSYHETVHSGIITKATETRQID